MTADGHRPLAKAKIAFFAALGLLIGLLYYSVLKTQPVVGYEFALLLALTGAALIFDYLKI